MLAQSRLVGAHFDHTTFRNRSLYELAIDRFGGAGKKARFLIWTIAICGSESLVVREER
jgi:hypothetical protein